MRHQPRRQSLEGMGATRIPSHAADGESLASRPDDSPQKRTLAGTTAHDLGGSGAPLRRMPILVFGSGTPAGRSVGRPGDTRCALTKPTRVSREDTQVPSRTTLRAAGIAPTMRRQFVGSIQPRPHCLLRTSQSGRNRHRFEFLTLDRGVRCRGSTERTSIVRGQHGAPERTLRQRCSCGYGRGTESDSSESSVID